MSTSSSESIVRGVGGEASAAAAEAILLLDLVSEKDGNASAAFRFSWEEIVSILEGSC